MNPLQIDNAQALRLFFQEELYVFPDTKLNSQDEVKQEELISEIAETGVGKAEKSLAPLNYLGGNGQRILILLKDTLHKDLHAEERKLLMAILEAIKIKVSDYALVFWDAHTDYLFQDFTRVLTSQRVLSFGMNSELLGLGELPFNAIHEQAGVKFILTHHLTALKDDVQAKRAFWSQLKVLFP
ncbi:MAG: hypothetical protein EOO99_04770 [Pedobacter sp.]|nr:MAG: hypothetical protein EOO99_04770 [Pedobacter sp.]